jgi:hypothetical protein
MKPTATRMCAAFVLAVVLMPFTAQAGGPYVKGRFQGRIAYSSDGNFNDPDDWAASPMALGIFAAAGLKGRVVHFDYNCILPRNNPQWARTHAESVLGAARRYGYDRAIFHDCRKDLDGAVKSIAKAINDSSAGDPLYFIVAGPMEVPVLGIRKSDKAKRKFVYCISHSAWNDGFSSNPRHNFFTYNKRHVIALGVRWVQIRDQNRLLRPNPYGREATEKQWGQYFWMRDSKDANVRFLWQRMKVSGHPDPSDAGMAYFLATGDEQADPVKLKRLLDAKRMPKPIAERRQVRLEAENFVHLDGYQLAMDRRASQRLAVTPLKKHDAGRIQTRFFEPYTAGRGRYDVQVRYFDDAGRRGRLVLSVNGAARDRWTTPGKGRGWSIHTVRGVELAAGAAIAVEARDALPRFDYIQLNRVQTPQRRVK